jgi:hypothetical protein
VTTTPLAELADYELLIGPVASTDEAKTNYMLLVSTSVVCGVAPGLLPWAQGNPPLDTDGVTPLPVPEPAVLVTCQTASNLSNDPTGGAKVTMQRVGLVEAQYAAGGDEDNLLPVAWRRLLKPWRAPEMASIVLTIPHPMAYAGYSDDWNWWWDELAPPAPTDPPYYDGWGNAELSTSP